jgi:hypothetical protein
LSGGEELRVARLHALLLARREDHQLYCTTVPRLSDALIAHYSAVRPVGFARVLAALGAHTAGELPFELCDELARFYAAVFWVAAYRSQRRLALALLLGLGASQRRYRVADVVRSCFGRHARAGMCWWCSTFWRSRLRRAGMRILIRCAGRSIRALPVRLLALGGGGVLDGWRSRSAGDVCVRGVDM